MEQRRRVTYTVGQGFDRHGTPLSNQDALRTSVLKDAVSLFGGFTTREVKGGWINASKDLVLEPSLEISVVTDVDTSTLELFAITLRVVFDQESVLMTVEALQLVEFI